MKCSPGFIEFSFIDLAETEFGYEDGMALCDICVVAFTDCRCEL